MTPRIPLNEPQPVGDRYALHLGGPVALAARCPHCNHRVIVEDRAAIEREAQAIPPSEALREALDPELAAIYLAAAMKECGYTATEADARSILDYLDGDNGVRLAATPPASGAIPLIDVEPVGPIRIQSANCAAGDHDECASMVEQDVSGLGITDCLCDCHADEAAPLRDVERLAEVLHGFDCSDLTLRGVDWRWLHGDYGSELDRKIHLKEAEEIASRYARISEPK